MADSIKKIIVKSEDELIDVVRKIVEADSERILVTFAEDSEMLISSINLKVLLDTADEKKSLLILQITNNPTGVRNAKLAEVPVIDTPSTPTEEEWLLAENEVKKRFEKISKKRVPLPEEYESENITSFEERVNSVLNKSKEERGQGEVDKTTDTDEIVIDQDLDYVEESSPKKEDLTKVDFKSVPDPMKKSPPKESGLISGLTSKFSDIKDSLGKKDASSKTQSDKSTRLKKLLPKILIPFVAVLLLSGFMYYYFAPSVNITLFIESKPVEVEKTFTGNENINEVDFENLEIPIKRETVSKSISDTVNATGTAFRGDKATGSVTISYINPDGCTDADDPVSLSEGHRIEADGKTFVLTGSVNITCNNYSVVGAEAAEVGEEYNLPSGKYFTVSGYQSTRVYGVNSGAFTGGSKEQYTVLSQQDVNSKVEDLKKNVIEDTLRSLKDVGDGWEIIEDTIKSDVKEGSIRTSVSIGAEASTADVSLEVEATATFYYTIGVDEGLNALLTEAAINQNLFEDGDGLNLTLTEDIDKELIVEGEGTSISIRLVAASAVEPSVNEDSIIDSLRGYNWNDGVEYLENLSFISEDPVIVFNPEGFPRGLRYFPRRRGRVVIDVKSTEVVEDV